MGKSVNFTPLNSAPIYSRNRSDFGALIFSCVDDATAKSTCSMRRAMKSLEKPITIKLQRSDYVEA